MHRLTREVRLGIGLSPTSGGLVPTAGDPGTNAFAANPRLNGLGVFLTVRVSLVGRLDPRSQYVRNIQDLDRVVRSAGEPVLRKALSAGDLGGLAVRDLAAAVSAGLPDASVDAVELLPSPFLSLTWRQQEPRMVRLSQKFEFSAAHRLHNPAMSDAENLSTFGKCNNPLGHGHNYELQVTVAAEPDAAGCVMPIGVLERVVHERVITRFDHKHLNAEVPEFAQVIPSVENIAAVIYRLLKPHVPTPAKLASVTVWETPKTWCEYSE